MSAQANQFGIIWRSVPKGWAGRKGAAQAPARVPYFLDHKSYAAYLRGQAVELNESMLLEGALHEWLTGIEQWQVSDQAALWDFFRSRLTRHSRREGYGSLATYLLTLSAKIRDAYGPIPSMKVLMAAHSLMPQHADIRSDLLLDVWTLTQLSDEIDKTTAYGLICYLYDGLRFDEISEDVADELDYANFVALSHFGDYQRRNWLFWRVISKRIRHKQLKHKMIQLLNRRPATLFSMHGHKMHAQAS